MHLQRAATLLAVVGSQSAFAQSQITTSRSSTSSITFPATAVLGLPTSCVANLAPAAPSQTVLSSVRTAIAFVEHNPFGLTFVNESYALLSLANGNTSTLGVLDTSQFTPRLIYQIPLPAAFTFPGGSAGLTLTHDKRHVLVTGGPGAIILDTQKAITGSADAIVGTLNDSNGTALNGAGRGAIQVTLTKHDHFAFISQEYGTQETRYTGNVDVWELTAPHRTSNVTGRQIGFLELGYEVVGSVLSPSGATLYVTSEATTARSATNGAISVVDVKTLKSNPKAALQGSIAAACAPVRAIVSKDGKILWVTARESDLLLAYDTKKLLSDPAHSLIAKVTVGTAPIGLAFVKGESRILTADSNRFRNPNATTGVTVVDVKKALKGGKANLGHVPTGLFPREIAVSPNGRTVLVAGYLGDSVQAIDVDTLP